MQSIDNVSRTSNNCLATNTHLTRCSALHSMNALGSTTSYDKTVTVAFRVDTGGTADILTQSPRLWDSVGIWQLEKLGSHSLRLHLHRTHFGLPFYFVLFTWVSTQFLSSHPSVGPNSQHWHDMRTRLTMPRFPPLFRNFHQDATRPTRPNKFRV